MIWIITLSIIVLFVFVIKPYRGANHVDTITLYTGGNGSGKSFFGVKKALSLLSKQRRKVAWKSFLLTCQFWKRNKTRPAKPLLYSTIPIRISRKEWSVQLTVEHLMLQEKIIEKSVVFIDEINLLVSQMDYGLKGEKALNEFVTLYRHYTKGGYLVACTQNLSKVHWIFRYCCNEAINLSEFRKPILGLPILAWAKVRKITLGDDIKAVETDDAHKQKSNLFGLFPLIRKYDTHCFSERYNSVPLKPNEAHKRYKLKRFEKIPVKTPFEPLTSDLDE